MSEVTGQVARNHRIMTTQALVNECVEFSTWVLRSGYGPDYESYQYMRADIVCLEIEETIKDIRRRGLMSELQEVLKEK